MSNDQPAQKNLPARTRHSILFVAGLALIVLGPVAYAVQLSAKNLSAPWYVPILATAGVALMLLSVWQRRGVVRILGLALFAVVCGLEWRILLVDMRTPAYTGPAQLGHKLPHFTAKLADGSPFSDKDVEKGTRTVLLFYRGHW
jgi:hypothetical protein